jgi:hypothetical protein
MYRPARSKKKDAEAADMGDEWFPGRINRVQAVDQ